VTNSKRLGVNSAVTNHELLCIVLYVMSSVLYVCIEIFDLLLRWTKISGCMKV